MSEEYGGSDAIAPAGLRVDALVKPPGTAMNMSDNSQRWSMARG
jgi:hypothetical protein